MKRRPVTERAEVSYPACKAKPFKVMGRWIRKVGVAVAVTSSAAFWAACPTIGGDVAYPEYYVETCEDNDPEPAQDFLYPGTFGRYLCPGQSTFAELTIEDQLTLSFELVDASYDSDSELHAVLTNEAGEVAGVLDSEGSTLELALTPGVWRVTVTQRSSYAEGEFSLHIDDVVD